MTIVASSSSSSTKMITLKSSDGDVFQVDESRACISETIKLAIAENSDSSTVPLEDVKGSVLAAIIRYMNEESKSADDFAKELSHDQEMLFGVVKAAYCLKIDPLTHSLCQTIADMVRGKSTEEIRELFHIKNDYTEAEFKQVMEETSFVEPDAESVEEESSFVDSDEESEEEDQETQPEGQLSGGADLELEDKRSQILRRVARWRKSREAEKARLARVFGPITRSQSVALVSRAMKLALAEDDTIFNSLSCYVMDTFMGYVRNVYHGSQTSHHFAEQLARDPGMLFGVLRAANYFRLEPLSNLIYKTIADMMNRNSVAEVHELFKDRSEAELEGVQEQISRFLDDVPKAESREKRGQFPIGTEGQWSGSASGEDEHSRKRQMLEKRQQIEAAERLQEMDVNGGEIERAAATQSLFKDSNEPTL